MFDFILYYRILSKNENEEFDESNQILKEVIILIIFSIILNSIYIYHLKVDYNIYSNAFQYSMIIFIFSILIEKICLKNYFYSHQILSFIIIIILYIYFIRLFNHN